MHNYKPPLLEVVVRSKHLARMARAKARMDAIVAVQVPDEENTAKFGAWLDAAIDFDAAAEHVYGVQVGNQTRPIEMLGDGLFVVK